MSLSPATSGFGLMGKKKGDVIGGPSFRAYCANPVGFRFSDFKFSWDSSGADLVGSVPMSFANLVFNDFREV